MSEKVGFLEEAPGKKSTMRLLSVQSWWASVCFGVLTILTDNEQGLMLTGLFAVAAFAPKAVQKFAEKIK